MHAILIENSKLLKSLNSKIKVNSSEKFPISFSQHFPLNLLVGLHWNSGSEVSGIHSWIMNVLKFVRETVRKFSVTVIVCWWFVSKTFNFNDDSASFNNDFSSLNDDFILLWTFERMFFREWKFQIPLSLEIMDAVACKTQRDDDDAVFLFLFFCRTPIHKRKSLLMLEEKPTIACSVVALKRVW